MTTLVLVECEDGVPVNGATCAITAAAPLGPMVVLACGSGALEASKLLAQLPGVSKVLAISPCGDGKPARAEALAPLIVQQCAHSHYSHIFSSAGANARAVLSRVAALLGVMALSDVVQVVDAITFVRPAHAGAVLMTVRLEDEVRVLSVRPSAFEQAQPSDAAALAAIEVVEPPTASSAASLLERQRASRDAGVELIGARVVVSGGRGVGSADGFQTLRPLAQALGAAIGASRAAVDAGYAPADSQVGQTGKTVAPDVYLAIGISGAIQHWAGMKDSKMIVAVNKDPEAPIFQFADYGLVADLFDVVPTLTNSLAKAP